LRASPCDDGLAPPATAERLVFDTIHGVRVADPYRWLEDSDDLEVRAWCEAQSRCARAVLDTWPERATLHARLTELMTEGAAAYTTVRSAGVRLFAIKRQPPLEQPLLVMLDSADDLSGQRIVCDPNALDPSGATAIDWFEPSFDGATVAVSLSRAGSERGDVHVIDASTGRARGDVVPRVHGGTAGGSLAWDAAGSGFYYTRYPRRGERPDADLPFHVQVYWHALGTDTSLDRYEIGADFPRIAEIQLESSRDGRFVLAGVQNGDGGEFMHWLRSAGGGWTAITRWEDGCLAARLGNDGVLYLVSRQGAPRGQILCAPLDGRPVSEGARTIVPEGDDAIQTSFSRGSGLWTGRDRLYVLYQQGGPNVLKVFDCSGRFLRTVATPALSTVDDVAVLEDGGALVSNQSLTEPPAWLRIAADGAAPRRTSLVEISKGDFSDCEVVRDEAVSKDGTRVPLTILRRAGTVLNRSNPTILYGYGGYGVSVTPSFRARIRAWTERGGVFVLAHLRGGGEFGDTWHRAGNLANKQNVFDDFAACAHRLNDAGYASPESLALLGGSNGGLLMGAMIVQHPGIARAVVSLVGLYDMIRVEGTPNGAYNVTEFGTIEDERLFRVLRAYSPYHNVRDGVDYPAVLLLTGENDPRVDPWHSRKMAARLQRATASRRPILLRTNAAAGHGMGTALSQQIDEFADVLTFVCRELGVGGQQPNC
jgi:prolyl oligopeptidase